MKKTLFFFILIFSLFSQNVNAVSVDEPTIYLSHNGKITIFRHDKLQEAIDSSVAGDTIYLSPGVFTSGDIYLNKPISIIGTGDNSYINTNLKLSYLEEQTLTSTLLHSLKIRSFKTYQTKGLDGVIINKCLIESLYSLQDLISAIFVSCKIDQANITGENIISFVNSYFKGYNKNSNARFINCNINFSEYTDNAGQMFNSICYVYGWYTLSALAKNCLTNRLPENNEDCYLDKDLTRNDQKELCFSGSDTPITKEQLLERNYLGSDGTVVGYYGGEHPFTLETDYPKFLEENVEVDNENENVKITIKLSAK